MAVKKIDPKNYYTDILRIFGYRNNLEPKNLEIILNDHNRIISALETQNADLACEEMKKTSSTRL
ncbi:MAG: hypothetical protein LBE12_15955 [Planctomycetaceae bacterium]|nr:hypothetical protein [Planctomycetaceae bacterium]